MLELNLVDERDKAAEKKRDQIEILVLEESFGGLKITEYPPKCISPEQSQQFDAEVLAAAQSASKEIGRDVSADSIRRTVCTYACRKFALQEVMPAANALAAELDVLIKAYEQENKDTTKGLLEQMTGAAEPLAEALNRLGRPATDNRIDMPKLLFIADMALIYTDLTGKKVGKTADRDTGTGSPFARFSFEAAKLAGCASTTVPQWAETLKKLLPSVLAYLKANDDQDALYDEWAAAEFGDKD